MFIFLSCKLYIFYAYYNNLTESVQGLKRPQKIKSHESGKDAILRPVGISIKGHDKCMTILF